LDKRGLEKPLLCCITGLDSRTGPEKLLGITRTCKTPWLLQMGGFVLVGGSVVFCFRVVVIFGMEGVREICWFVAVFPWVWQRKEAVVGELRKVEEHLGVSSPTSAEKKQLLF